mmetsp:Transcript_2862/g.5285  ORF Transcript_2862/g.5285 Transcript_2862/m.5285 type:complete len:84 (-) Transcript_2862:20-271(-)
MRDNDLERGIAHGKGALSFDSVEAGGTGVRNGWIGAASKIFSVWIDSAPDGGVGGRDEGRDDDGEVWLLSVPNGLEDRLFSSV